jgi:hypothetical protein
MLSKLWGCDSHSQGKVMGKWVDRAVWENEAIRLIRHPLLYITESVNEWYNIYRYAGKTIPYDTVDPRYADAISQYEEWIK